MVAKKTALLADSTCDIPAPLVERYELRIVPAYVVWGEEVLQDGVDIQPAAFYRRLEHDPVYPSTAHASPEDFAAVYREEFEAGAEAVLIFTVSSALSGTFNAAQQGAAAVAGPVTVIDAKGPTMSLGWQVLAAARAREAGGGRSEMIAAAAQARSTLVQYVALDTMEYLQKGGRIGRASRLLGTLLNIKPLLRIDHEAGVVEAAGRPRTHSKAIDSLYQAFFEELQPQDGAGLHIAVLHGDAPEEAKALAERIHSEYAPGELLITSTGPVLGVHTGPRALALCGYKEAG